jgi:hypothetical protein
LRKTKTRAEDDNDGGGDDNDDDGEEETEEEEEEASSSSFVATSEATTLRSSTQRPTSEGIPCNDDAALAAVWRREEMAFWVENSSPASMS